jgi:hypothetical protein
VGLSHEAIQVIYEEQPIGDKFRGSTSGEGYLSHTLEKVDQKVGEADKVEPPPQEAFVEHGDTYYMGDQQVSTFVIDPKRLYVSDSGGPDVFVANIRTRDGVWKNSLLPKTAFHSTAELVRTMSSVHHAWLGTDRQARLLLPYLVGKWQALGSPSAQMTSVIGRHDSYWVSTSEVLSSSEELDIMTAPIVFAPTGRQVPPLRYDTSLPSDEYLALAARVNELLPEINLSEIVWPAVGWFFAAPFKSLLNERQIRFPILNLYGNRGSGKTSMLLKVLMPLLGYTQAHSNDCSTTHFVLMSLLSCTNSVPIYLTEFRRATISDKEFSSLKRMLLQSYDVGQDSRGRPDQSTVTYELSAPLVLDGEDDVRDAAVLERSIVLSMDPMSILEGSTAYRAFNSLVEVGGLHRFAGKYIQYTLGWSAERTQEEWERCYNEVHKAIPRVIPDRPRRNLATVWFGINRYLEYMASLGLKTPKPPCASLLETCLENVVSIEMGRTTMLVDEFVTDLLIEVAMSRAYQAFIYAYRKDNNTLWFHLTSAYNWWIRKRRSEGLPTMTSAAIKSQLKERHEGLGLNPGQYVLGPKTTYVDGSSKHMYGLDLDRCSSCGLDVPSNIQLFMASSSPSVLGKESQDEDITNG